MATHRHPAMPNEMLWIISTEPGIRPYGSANKNGTIAMLNLKVVSWSLGIFTAISFSLCVLYGLIVPPSLHVARALEAVLPAFKWLTFPGFLLGLAESFLYGVYAGLVFVPVYNAFNRRWGSAHGHDPESRTSSGQR